MIRQRFLLHFNSLMFRDDRGSQRVALGLIAASLVLAPAVSAKR
jgi:hypothetical protein